MIAARIGFDALAARLAARAAKLAQAHVAGRVLASRRDERRWRSAALVWPLFGREK